MRGWTHLLICLGATSSLFLSSCDRKPSKGSAQRPNPSAAGKERTSKLRSDASRAGNARAVQPALKSAPLKPVRWKGVVMTGDDSIVAFDNARRRIREEWIDAGIRPDNIRELSMARAEQKGGVKASSARALGQALKSLKIGEEDGCLVHLTSHGAPWGFYLKGQAPLTPTALDALLTKSCGTRPTVVFVSACYSGIFTSNVLKRPGRAIFTAARDDRSSFGCGVEDTYTFWDACMIDQLPKAASWTALKGGLETCIRGKERETRLHFSYPSAYIGRNLAATAVPRRTAGEVP